MRYITENKEKQVIRRIVESVVYDYLFEKKKSKKSKSKSQKSKTGDEKKADEILNDPHINNAELANDVLPRSWKDSTKRSYISKLKRGKRKASKKLIKDINNAIN